MERIINQQHSKDAFLFAFSKLFESASYYGIRVLIVLYVGSESFQMSSVEALKNTVFGVLNKFSLQLLKNQPV